MANYCSDFVHGTCSKVAEPASSGIPSQENILSRSYFSKQRHRGDSNENPTAYQVPLILMLQLLSNRELCTKTSEQ